MVLDWASSGQGRCSISLNDAQLLALEAGFTFKGSNESLPLARRADLQAMFGHFEVGTLTAFRELFWTHRLQPHAANGKRIASRGALQPDPATHTGSQWHVQQNGSEVYIGEHVNGMPHGNGILLTKAERSWLLYVGQFARGKRDGLGVVSTSRGERLEGTFKDDLPWGPAIYTYPLASAAGGSGGNHTAAAKTRLQFQGIMNGRPNGKGCITWSDGSREAGQFDGNTCCQALEDEHIEGVLECATNAAKEARALAEALQAEALQQAHIGHEARAVFERVAIRASSPAAWLLSDPPTAA